MCQSLFNRCLLILMFSFSQQATAEIYTWTDGSGRVHFTDSPPLEAQTTQIEISPLNTYQSPSSDSIKNILERPTDDADGQTNVTLYSTTWCGYCKKARRWLRKNNIPFDEYDTEKSVRGRRDYKKMNGTGVPIIKVGKKSVQGFSKKQITQLLRKAGYKI